jgi:Fe2+ or Zn2+ uptake regulation protein
MTVVPSKVKMSQVLSNVNSTESSASDSSIYRTFATLKESGQAANH